MKLTQDEKDLLSGKKGEIVAKLMDLLVKMGDARGAEEMVDVYSVHASTVILEFTGYPGVELMEEVRDSGIKFKAFTTVDPISIDIEDWKTLGLSKDYAELQLRSVKAFGECGGVGEYTCTPWLVGNVPRRGSACGLGGDLRGDLCELDVRGEDEPACGSECVGGSDMREDAEIWVSSG